MEFCFRKIFPRTPKFFVKTILNYCIGNYLSKELNEDQIEIIDNHAQCSNIDINIKVVNDNFEKQNIPLTLLYGYIGCIRIYLPSKAQDGKLIFEIKDLELCIGPASRNSTPDPNIVFGSMVDSMVLMQRSFHEESFSDLIFEEKYKGKNFNALISKWISKLSLRFHNTKISFETRPIPQIDRCCRFLCEIEKIDFGTRDTENLNLNSATLMGILLKNNVEIIGFTIRWEVAVRKAEENLEITSLNNSSKVILYGCQIFSISNTVHVNYTLLLTNAEPEFEINFKIDTVHVLLAPLPIHWIEVLGSQIAVRHEDDSDSSISKNVKMTQSQYDSFFPIEERFTSSLRCPPQDSIYYDVDSFYDNSSIQNTYDDLCLHNFEEEIDTDPSQKDSNSSFISSISIFDDEGKMNTNFKATLSVKCFCLKLLLHNPTNDFGNDILDFRTDSISLTQKYKEWDYISTKFFGLLKTVDKCSESFSILEQFHKESGDIDYLSFLLSNFLCSILTKKFNEKSHKTFLFSIDALQMSETLYKNSITNENSLPIISIFATDEGSHSNQSKAIDVKIKYNSLQNESSFEISLGRCYFGVDISIQDRIRLLTQNDLLDYHISPKSNTYDINRTGSDNPFNCLAVVQISDLCLNVHVPIINLNDEIHSKSYWQYRLLHPETLELNMKNCRFIYRTISDNSLKFQGVCDDVGVVELYTNSIIMSFSSPTIDSLPILNIMNDLEDVSPIVVFKIKSKVLHKIEEENSLPSIIDESSFPYNNNLYSKKNIHKPYNTKESERNSNTKFIHTPSDKENIDKYIRNSINNSHLDIEIRASTLLSLINDKNILEIIYHRLAFDLLLWESNYDKRNNNVIINCKSKDMCETDDETNTDTSYEEESNFSKTKSINQSILKKLTITTKIDWGRIYLQNVSLNHKTESVVELNHVIIFTDSDIVDGLIETQSILIAQISKMKIFFSDDPFDNSFDLRKLTDKNLTLTNNYFCVVDEVPETLISKAASKESTVNMAVLIMDSQLSKLNKSKNHFKIKQKASNILTAQLNRFCLRHNYIYDSCNGFGWVKNLTDLLSLNNPVITGYVLPDSDTSMHLHWKDCAVDLCFSHFPMSVIAILNKIELEIISNITESYHLNIEIALSGSQIYIKFNDNLALAFYFLWNNDNWFPLSLIDHGFCYVADLGNLDLKFTKIGSANSSDKETTCNVVITNSETNVHLCADSLSLIVNCISQLFSLNTDTTTEENIPSVGSFSSFRQGSDTNINQFQSQVLLNESDKTRFNHMITDAMKEDGMSIKINNHKKDEFCDGFLLVDDLFPNINDRIVSLENNYNQKLSVVQDHYKSPSTDDKYSKTKKNVYRDPDGYPVSHKSMVIHDFSISINFYAGSDLDAKCKIKQTHSKTKIRSKMIPPVKFQRFNSDLRNQVNIQTCDFDAYFGDKESKIPVLQGGSNRKLNEHYQLRFKKINFRYALFSAVDWRNTIYQQISRRLVFTINDVELISYNVNSNINMVLFCDSNAKFWYDPKSPMINFRTVFFQSNPDQDVVKEECDIKLSIQPILLNFDQDFVIFIEKFYQDSIAKDLFHISYLESKTYQSSNSSVRSESPHQDSILIPPSKNINKELILGRGGGMDSITGSSPLSRASTMRLPAFDEMRVKKEEDDDVENNQAMTSTSKSLSTIFIRRFSIYPDLYFKLDYTGTRLDFTQGAIKGLLYILIQLNNVVFIIKSKQYIEGITGFDMLLQILSKEIYEEFISQLNKILTKVGPISEITEMLSGIYDLFSLPYQYYHNERGLIEGIKLGTRSITTTSLWATLTLLSKGLKVFQKMAETTYDFVSPCTSIRDDESERSTRDFREGVTNAACSVRRRFNNSTYAMQLALHRSDRPIFGRMGDVIRQVPPVFASPIVATCAASNELIDGLRYQLKPEMKIEDEKKWKH